MHQLVGAGWSDTQHLRYHFCVEEQWQFLVGLDGFLHFHFLQTMLDFSIVIM